MDGQLSTHEELARVMDFDHVIEVLGDGSWREPGGISAPEAELSCTGDGNYQVLPRHAAEMAAHLGQQGWELMAGYSQQDHYDGPLMHSSESVSGGLAAAILARPGLYVAVAVTAEAEPPDECTIEHAWLGGIICARCGRHCDCTVCRAGQEADYSDASWAVAYRERRARNER